MKMKIQRIIELARLIAMNISNQISMKEKEDLDSWRNESGRNEQLYNRIVNWDNFEKRNQSWESFDADRAWAKFSKQQKKKHLKLYPKQMLRYAAAVLIPLVLGGVLFYYLSNEQKNVDNRHNTSETVASITPGTPNAVIILDNGESIDLENEEINQLVEKDGSVITNKNGLLNYSGVKETEPEDQLKNTLVVPRGGEYTLVLSDGSRVFLNSVSKLVYPVVFSEDKREVTLKGEAYFEIAKDVNKPFIVNVDGVKIEVLGTSFNVKAYEEESNIFTTLVEGKVKLNADENERGCILVPDQQAVVDRNSNNITVKKVDVQQFIGWKNGIYSFADQSVEDIMRTLSRWYDFEYEFTDESLKAIHFEGGVNKYENIYPILDIMQSTEKLKYKVDGNKIIFTKK